MIKLRKLIKESAWDRKFGEPLPTLSGIMEKHGDCGCGGTHACACESVNEDAKDVMKAKKIQQNRKYGHDIRYCEGLAPNSEHQLLPTSRSAGWGWQELVF